MAAATPTTTSRGLGELRAADWDGADYYAVTTFTYLAKRA
jgi:hypothetical protein